VTIFHPVQIYKIIANPAIAFDNLVAPFPYQILVIFDLVNNFRLQSWILLKSRVVRAFYFVKDNVYSFIVTMQSSEVDI